MFLDQLGDLSILEEINQVVQVPMKFIHVHRNPFDNIATKMLRATESRDAVREEGLRVKKFFFNIIYHHTLLLTTILEVIVKT